MFNKIKPAIIFLIAPMMIIAFGSQAQTTINLGQKIKNAAQTKIQELKDIRVERDIDREEIKKTIQEKIQEKKQVLTEKLKNIKDKTKARTVEKIYNNVSLLNERLTKHYDDVLNNLEVILGKIENRANIAKDNGRDITAVEVAITTAKNAILTGRTAISAQREKIYSIEARSDDTLKNDTGIIRQSFHNDLKKIFQFVSAARKATQDAAIKLAKMPKIDELKPIENQ